MNQAVDILGAVVVVGGIFVLTRPGSQGPGLLSAFFSGFGNVLGTAEGTVGKNGALASNYR